MKKHLLMSLAFLLTFLCFDKVNATNLSLAWTKTPSEDYAYRKAKFSPNGKKIAFGTKISDYDTNMTVLILDASTGDSLVSLSGHKGFFLCSMTWLNDSILATGDANSEYHHPRTLRIWNVNTGENIHTFFNDTLYPWHSAISNIVYLKGKNKLYVDLYTNARVQVNSSPPWTYAYYADSLLVINTLTWEIIKPLYFNDSINYKKIDLVCGAPDGSYYAIDFAGRQQLRDPDTDSIIWKSDSAMSFGFDLMSLNGKYGVGITTDAAFIYDINNHSYYNTILFDSINNINYAVISPDSRYIAVAGYYEKKDYRSIDRFAYAEIENPTNRFFRDSIEYANIGLEASNDSLYLLFLQEGKIWVYIAPWSPLNSINTKPVDSEQSILYPNPTNDYITVNVGANGRSPEGIKIFDVFGQEEHPPTPSYEEGELRVDVSALPPGVYFVRVGNKVQKFIKY